MFSDNEQNRTDLQKKLDRMELIRRKGVIDNLLASKWEYINLLKAVVILMIVLNHSIQYKRNAYKIFTNDFQNPILIFTSGIIFSYCIENKNRYVIIRDLLNNICKRLLIPFALTALFYYLPIMKIVNNIHSVDDCYSRPIYRIVIDYLLGLNINQLWFIYELFIMCFIMQFVVKKTFLIRTTKGNIAFLLFLFLLNIITYNINISYFCIV